MEKQKAILQHKIRTIQDKIYDLVQEQKVLQTEFDSLEETKVIDSDINSWSEEKRVYFELVGKLNEPERSIFLEGFNEKIFKLRLKSHHVRLESITIDECLNCGYNTKNNSYSVFKTVHDKLVDNTYQFDKI